VPPENELALNPAFSPAEKERRSQRVWWYTRLEPRSAPLDKLVRHATVSTMWVWRLNPRRQVAMQMWFRSAQRSLNTWDGKEKNMNQATT